MTCTSSKSMAAFAAVMVTSPVVAQEITVWDVNVTRNPSYYDAAKATFEKAHPGVTLTCGAARCRILQSAEHRPRLRRPARRVLGQWGASAKSPTGGLVPLDDRLPDLISQVVGKSAFTGADGKLYFIPSTLQGHVVYYNKDMYKAAGLDPDKPPTTWAEVTKRCATPSRPQAKPAS